MRFMIGIVAAFITLGLVAAIFGVTGLAINGAAISQTLFGLFFIALLVGVILEAAGILD